MTWLFHLRNRSPILPQLQHAAIWRILRAKRNRLRQHKLAVDELNTAILLDPSDPDFWKGLSLNYTATRETQLSKQCADIAAQLSAKKAKPVLK
jgi:hypothetical protein